MTASVEQFEGLVGTYQLLSRFWIAEVDEPLLAALRRPPLCDRFADAGGSLPVDTARATLDQLAIDFCQLFLGPSHHLPPYQSVWQRGQFQSESADSMRKYLSCLSPTPFQDGDILLDHLGIQLDVMGRLVAFGARSDQQAVQVSEMAVAYFADHLTWANPLLDAAIERATTNFYRSMLTMTQAFLNSEAAHWRAVGDTN